MRWLTVYSPEEMTPRQADVIRTLIDEYRAERDELIQVRETNHRQTGPVLVFGSQGPELRHPQATFQYTYSLKQFESRANAKTVFFAALDTYFGFVKGLPYDIGYDHYYTIAFFKANIETRFNLAEPIAVDVETGGILGETVTARTAPMLSISLAQGPLALVLKLQWNEAAGGPRQNEDDLLDKLNYLRELLPKIKKPIFHNGKFDITVIENNTGVRMPNWFDTMLAHHVLNMAAREHGLKALCKRYFNADDWEANIKKDLGKSKDYGDIRPDVLAMYSAFDVLWTYRLWEHLAPLIGGDDNAQMALYLEMQAADFLMDVEAVGIPVSEAEVDNLLVQYEAEQEVARLQLQEITEDLNFNPGSWQQVKRWLEDQGVTVSSTNEEAINAILQEHKHNLWIRRFCESLLKYRKAQKMSGTYVKAWWKAAQIEGDSRVHPSFHVHGTTTGRLSSSDPNAQNVPRDKKIRRMVTVDESNQLV